MVLKKERPPCVGNSKIMSNEQPMTKRQRIENRNGEQQSTMGPPKDEHESPPDLLVTSGVGGRVESVPPITEMGTGSVSIGLPISSTGTSSSCSSSSLSSSGSSPISSSTSSPSSSLMSSMQPQQENNHQNSSQLHHSTNEIKCNSSHDEVDKMTIVSHCASSSLTNMNENIPDLIRTSSNISMNCLTGGANNNNNNSNSNNNNISINNCNNNSLINSEMAEFEEYLIKQCLCGVSERTLRKPFQSHYNHDMNGVKRVANLNEWPINKLMQFLSNLQLLFDIYLKQNSKGFICSRIMSVCNALIKNDHNLIDEIIELANFNNKYVQFLAGRVLASFLVIAKNNMDDNWLKKLVDNLFTFEHLDYMAVRKMHFSLEIIKRIVEWKDIDIHLLEDEVDNNQHHRDSSVPSNLSLENNYFAIQFNNEMSAAPTSSTVSGNGAIMNAAGGAGTSGRSNANNIVGTGGSNSASTSSNMAIDLNRMQLINGRENSYSNIFSNGITETHLIGISGSSNNSGGNINGNNSSNNSSNNNSSGSTSGIIMNSSKKSLNSNNMNDDDDDEDDDDEEDAENFHGANENGCYLIRLTDSESFDTTHLKCVTIKTLENKWPALVKNMSNLISSHWDINNAESCILTFLSLWENIISVKANLSIIETLPFYAQLDKFELLLNQNLSCTVYKQMLNLFNEALCYGSTLALQDLLPEETCMLAHQIVRHVKDFRILDSLPRRHPENNVSLLGYKGITATYRMNEGDIFRTRIISGMSSSSPSSSSTSSLILREPGTLVTPSITSSAASSLSRNNQRFHFNSFSNSNSFHHHLHHHQNRYDNDDEDDDNHHEVNDTGAGSGNISSSLNDDIPSDMDKTILQKMVLLVLKSVAVTVKEIRSDSSDTSIDSTDYDAFQDMVLIERSIRDVLKKLESFIKNTLEFHPECHFSKILIHLFDDQDDHLIEAMVCTLDVTAGISFRNNAFPELVSMLNPVYTFLEFLKMISNSSDLLLDLLVSNETCFLLYLLRFLKYIRLNWSMFIVSCQEFGMGSNTLDDAMSVLIRLRLQISRLVSKSLYPYDISPVLRLLESCESLYEGNELS